MLFSLELAGPRDWMDGEARAQGWRTALQAADLTADFLVEADWSADSGYEIGKKLVSTRPVTALFVGNDQMR